MGKWTLVPITSWHDVPGDLTLRSELGIEAVQVRVIGPSKVSRLKGSMIDEMFSSMGGEKARSEISRVAEKRVEAKRRRRRRRTTPDTSDDGKDPLEKACFTWWIWIVPTLYRVRTADGDAEPPEGLLDVIDDKSARWLARKGLERNGQIEPEGNASPPSSTG